MTVLLFFVTLARAQAPTPAEVEYRVALDAWQHADVQAAMAAVSRTVELDPGHRPARLLAGYALLRTDAREAGLAVLTSLAAEPLYTSADAKVRSYAQRAVHRVDDRNHRDQVSVLFCTSFGPERGGERGAGSWRPAGAHAWQLGVPLAEGLTLRFDAQHRWDTDTEDVGGWRLTPMLAWSRGSGSAAVDLGVGPTTWVARGVWWPSGTHVYAGARVAAGADWRFGRRVGLRVEAAVTPLVLDDTLWWYGSPVDARLGFATWFGHPRRGPLTGVGGG